MTRMRPSSRIAVALAANAGRSGPDARRAAVHSLSQHPGAAGKSLLRILVGMAPLIS